MSSLLCLRWTGYLCLDASEWSWDGDRTGTGDLNSLFRLRSLFDRPPILSTKKTSHSTEDEQESQLMTVVEQSEEVDGFPSFPWGD